MTDRGARPSLWRRPGLALRTTGDVTPATIYNSSAAALARSNPVTAQRAVLAVRETSQSHTELTQNPRQRMKSSAF